MEESVQRELETLKGMVLRWKQDYLGWAPSEGGGEYLVRDFLEEIETHVYPYVKRLYECQYLSGVEAKAFLDFCYDQAAELRNAVGETEGKPVPAKGG